MKKKLIQYVSVLLSFLAGLFLTSYLTQVGNRDMTTSMAEAVLPVLYAETEGTLYNEMHGYRTDMDGGYMKDSVIAVQEDHVLKLALDARVYAGRAFLRPADINHVTRRSELVRHTHATADKRFGIGGP